MLAPTLARVGSVSDLPFQQIGHHHMCECFSTESDDDWCGLVQDLVVSGRIVASVDLMVPSFVWASSDIEMCLECFCLS